MQNRNPKFRTLEHPADVMVQAFGKTREELFINAMMGMNKILKSKVKSKKSKVTRKIIVNSYDLDALLVDFLSEVLYLSQVNREIYTDVKFEKFSDKELTGKLIGRKVDRFGEDIKAVTYHGLKIEQDNGLYQASILFDI